MLRVINLKNYKLNSGEILIRVDRSSVVGNPFRMNCEAERNRVCDEYEKYFNAKVKVKGSAFRKEIIRIYSLVAKGYDVALGCWCAPKRCHADYIKKFIESYIN